MSQQFENSSAPKEEEAPGTQEQQNSEYSEEEYEGLHIKKKKIKHQTSFQNDPHYNQLQKSNLLKIIREYLQKIYEPQEKSEMQEELKDFCSSQIYANISINRCDSITIENLINQCSLLNQDEIKEFITSHKKQEKYEKYFEYLASLRQYCPKQIIYEIIFIAFKVFLIMDNSKDILINSTIWLKSALINLTKNLLENYQSSFNYLNMNYASGNINAEKAKQCFPKFLQECTIILGLALQGYYKNPEQFHEWAEKDLMQIVEYNE